MIHHVAARSATLTWLLQPRLRSTTAVVLLALWAVPFAHAHLSISNAGTAMVNLPITVPPGIAGLVPNLALVHDGRGVNGLVGQGWSLQGTSGITRCNAIAAIDLVPRSVANTPEDKLCLDGQRLIQADAAGNAMSFPQTGDSLGVTAGMREYRTETDSFSRIRAYGVAGGAATNGPAYFKVWTKSGQIIEYGNASNPMANATVMPTGETVVVTWQVSRIGDLRGNYIDFQYEQRNLSWGSTPASGPLTPGLEVTLQEIRYTGTPGRAPNNRIAFVYDDRPASAPTGQAHDRAEVYALGNKTLRVKRLAKIQTYINVTATPVKVKTYKLTYSQGPTSNRSRLDQVSECAGPAEQPCLPPTRMEYTAGAGQAYQASAAFRASELAGRVMHSIPAPTSYAGANPPIKYGVISADFSGDGKADILRWSENPAENELYFSNGDGSFRRIAAFNITDQIFYRHDGCFGSRVADINGDGLPDILRYRDTSGTWPGGVPHACPTGATEIYLSKGDGSFTRKSINGVSLTNRYNMLTHGDPLPGEPAGDLIGWTGGYTYYLLDINNDGKADVVTSYLPQQGNVVPPEPSNPCRVVCTRVYLGDGQGNFSEIATNVAGTNLYSPPQGAYAPGQPSLIEDFDGDGLMDIVGVGMFGQETEHNQPQVWRNRGDGNFDKAAYGSKGLGRAIDFNGDARSDLINPGTNTSLPSLFVSDGLNDYRHVGHNFTFALSEYVFTESQTRYTADILVADFDNDGRQDVLRWHQDPSKCTMFLSNGDGTFRESTSFNLKATDQVLKNSAGTNELILGDFTGRGHIEILRLAATAGTSGAQSNQLYLPVGSAPPPDQLVAMVSSQGLRTDLIWVPLGNSASGSLGERYIGDRTDTAHVATYPLADTMRPIWLVATTTADSGVGSERVATEYSYRGQKTSLDGRGDGGLREVRRQQPAADGSSVLTTVSQQLQQHPYIGAMAQSETWLGALNQTSPTVLSRSRRIYCDQTAAVGAETAADVTTPCRTLAKIQRPYAYKSIEEGWDLAGASLPGITTIYGVNDTGDPTTMVAYTTGTLAGLSQTFIKTTSYQYQPNQTSDDQWILGRVQQVSVQNKVPDSLVNLSSSTGSAANAGATTGSGPLQTATLTPLAFGNVEVGLSTTLNATLTSTGLTPLTLTVPSATAVSGTDFSFVSTNCSTTLAVGSSCTVSVRFSPASALSRSGTLTLGIRSGSLSASLDGTGTGGSSTAVLTSAAAINLGSVSVGTTAPQQDWTWRNDGNAPMNLSLSALNAPFSQVASTCTGVLPGSTCAITVQMGTGSGGNYSQGSIAVSGATMGNRADLGLTGTVQALTSLTGSPASLDFGTVTKGLNKNLTLTVSNARNYATTGLVYAFANPPGAVVRGSYAFGPGVAGWGTCPAAGGSLAAGASCTVIVKYSADCAGGSNNGTLSVSGTNFTMLNTALKATTSSSGSCQ